MKAFGSRAEGLRLERIRASPQWLDAAMGGRFRNVAPIAPGLRDPAAKMPSLTDFLCGGTRHVPTGPLSAQHQPRPL
jgi:hypothetical protein